MHRTIDAGDAADKRQYDYHVEKLRRDDDDRKRRHASGIAIVWTLLAATIGFTWHLAHRIREMLRRHRNDPFEGPVEAESREHISRTMSQNTPALM